MRSTQHSVYALLTELGYMPRVVNSRKQLLDAARGDGARYDVILLDVALRGMDGVECTQQLRDDRTSDSYLTQQRTYIIALTAKANTRSEQRCLRDAGVNSFLPEPVTLKELADVLKKAKKAVEQWDTEHIMRGYLDGHEYTTDKPSGWSESADGRSPQAPLIAFEADSRDTTKDALAVAGKDSWILTECVDAVNRFSRSLCFKQLLCRLLLKCTDAVQLSVLDVKDTPPDQLHAAITNKLRLVIVDQQCSDPAHYMESVPEKGWIRIDARLLEYLHSLPHPTTAEQTARVKLLRALITAKLLHEVAHMHTPGLMAHIRTVFHALPRAASISNNTPPKVCPYPTMSKRTPSTESRRVFRGEIGTAMEEVLLEGYSLHMKDKAATYNELTVLVARQDGVDCPITPAGIERLQPAHFTERSQSGHFDVSRHIKQGKRGKRKATDVLEQGDRAALRYDEGDVEESGGEECVVYAEYREDTHWPDVKG